MNCTNCDRPLGANEYELCRKCRRDENPNTRDYEECVLSECAKAGIKPAESAEETLRTLLLHHIHLERALTQSLERKKPTVRAFA